ncbi:MAG: hypothetical protein IPL53_12445 [Ignavibacteria bacterium]|nr:hypothetical protein [Ignavibacteria bacterium]
MSIKILPKNFHLLCSLTFILIIFSAEYSQAQKVSYIYPRPKWTIVIGPAWNLATNDAYGRANYSNQSQVLADNYGMRWGWGAFLEGKYSFGKKMRSDRIFLGVNYKGMANSDFEGSDKANQTKFDFITVDAGYEYLFYGTSTFRSYYGGGLTGNIISGSYNPNPSIDDTTNIARTFESSFRLGMELKAGLEFIFKNKNRNLGISIGAKYNLTNLFTDNNAVIASGQSQSLNDGSGTPGPGFKRYIGVVSVDVGFTIYPDVKRKVRK